jgi:hypothetical protein
MVRKLVKKALEDSGYHAIEQDNFPLDYRELVDKLRNQIATCDAVIHIAGCCFGAEPRQRPEGRTTAAILSWNTTSPARWASQFMCS